MAAAIRLHYQPGPYPLFNALSVELENAVRVWPLWCRGRGSGVSSSMPGVRISPAWLPRHTTAPSVYPLGRGGMEGGGAAHLKLASGSCCFHRQTIPALVRLSPHEGDKQGEGGGGGCWLAGLMGSATVHHEG